jgi:hypothetical protein
MKYVVYVIIAGVFFLYVYRSLAYIKWLNNHKSLSYRLKLFHKAMILLIPFAWV